MKLYFLNGPKQKSDWLLEPPEVRIGRETDNTVQLLVGGVSRYHAKISLNKRKQWVIEDLGSTNGTKVNGIPITEPFVLHPGNVLIIGDQYIRIDDEARDAAANRTSASAASGEESQSDPSGPAKEIPAPGKTESSPFSSFQIKPPETVKKDSVPKKSSAPVFFKPAPLKDPASKESDQKKSDQKKDEETGKAFSKEKKDSSGVSRITNISGTSAASGESASEISDASEAKKTEFAPIGDIFSAEESNKETGNSRDGKPSASKKISNLTFTVAVIGLGIICISLFLIWNKNTPEKTVRQELRPEHNPMFISYEKMETSSKGIFRFAFLLETSQEVVIDSGLKKIEEQGVMKFSIDILNADDPPVKYASEAIKVKGGALKKLKNRIPQTDFLKLVQEESCPPQNGVDKKSMITFGYHGNLNSITVHNTYPKNSFASFQNAIEDFTEDVSGYKTVFMSVSELKEEAEKHFSAAEDLYENYAAKPENLRKAIARYKLTISLLDRFQPHPPKWKKASERLETAQTLLKKIRTDAYNDLKIKLKLKDYPGALEKAVVLLDYLEPDSDNYNRIRDVKINLERQLANNKRRK